jgi:hypothetical protein
MILFTQNLWPFPLPFPSTGKSLSRQPSWPDDQDSSAWQQPKRVPIPSPFVQLYWGTSGVYALIIGIGQSGTSRVANAGSVGYLVWIGRNALPDLTGTPHFVSSLPASIPLTPPVSGIDTINVLVQAQDQYGLASVNQFCHTFLIDSSGNVYLPQVTGPSSVSAVQQQGGVVSVLAAYAGLLTDDPPADQWRVWIGSSPPSTSGPPAATASVNGKAIRIDLPAQSPGTYYVVMGLYRIQDASLVTVTTMVVVTAPPTEPAAVFSGFDGL